MRCGAILKKDACCSFRVWAPNRICVDLVLSDTAQILHTIPMTKDAEGYWTVEYGPINSGCTYRYQLDEELIRPDPASSLQPDGVHGASAVIDHNLYQWDDEAWQGIPQNEYIIYELHIGTFTPEGTFAAAADRLDKLTSLGITAIEIMPVAAFPGERNWGYDGVYLYAVQASYGGADGLKYFVDQCHMRGIAVVLDVVYNHLGPEGNYLWDYGPYFTDRYVTPWGAAINYDGPLSDHVRSFIIENAWYWIEFFHVDALRLDAVHGIFDTSARHLLQELVTVTAARAAACNRFHVYLIAESDLNDTRHVTTQTSGGYGLHAQWCDEFHHALHTVVTGEQSGYYRDFLGVKQLVKAYNEGFVFSGEYSIVRQRKFGSSSKTIEPNKFVVFSQNHDQIGNRMLGERLITLAGFNFAKVAAAAVLTAPYLPLLFMGEEYGESAPFLYFVSHGDPGLVEAVRKGRTDEFAAFSWRGTVADPQDNQTFAKSKLLAWSSRTTKQKALYEFYRQLITLRKTVPLLLHSKRRECFAYQCENKNALVVERRSTTERIVSVFNFDKQLVEIFLNGNSYAKLLDSADAAWGGLGGRDAVRGDGTVTLYLQPESFLMCQIID